MCSGKMPGNETFPVTGAEMSGNTSSTEVRARLAPGTLEKSSRVKTESEKLELLCPGQLLGFRSRWSAALK